jgi:hypothetical protein
MKKEPIESPSQTYNDWYHRLNKIFRNLKPSDRDKFAQSEKAKKKQVSLTK